MQHFLLRSLLPVWFDRAMVNNEGNEKTIIKKIGTVLYIIHNAWTFVTNHSTGEIQFIPILFLRYPMKFKC